jgi:DNA replicative helicase MCM subunit Mcm2 (Cdc46/Mcm family)
MTTMTHTCDTCDSTFTIKYNESETDTDPGFCPFCGEMIIDCEFDDDEDE